MNNKYIFIDPDPNHRFKFPASLKNKLIEKINTFTYLGRGYGFDDKSGFEPLSSTRNQIMEQCIYFTVYAWNFGNSDSSLKHSIIMSHTATAKYGDHYYISVDYNSNSKTHISIAYYRPNETKENFYMSKSELMTSDNNRVENVLRELIGSDLAGLDPHLFYSSDIRWDVFLSESLFPLIYAYTHPTWRLFLANGIVINSLPIYKTTTTQYGNIINLTINIPQEQKMCLKQSYLALLSPYTYVYEPTNSGYQSNSSRIVCNTRTKTDISYISEFSYYVYLALTNQLITISNVILPELSFYKLDDNYEINLKNSRILTQYIYTNNISLLSNYKNVYSDNNLKIGCLEINDNLFISIYDNFNQEQLLSKKYLDKFKNNIIYNCYKDYSSVLNRLKPLKEYNKVFIYSFGCYLFSLFDQLNLDTINYKVYAEGLISTINNSYKQKYDFIGINYYQDLIVNKKIMFQTYLQKIDINYLINYKGEILDGYNIHTLENYMKIDLDI